MYRNSKFHKIIAVFISNGCQLTASFFFFASETTTVSVDGCSWQSHYMRPSLACPACQFVLVGLVSPLLVTSSKPARLGLRFTMTRGIGSCLEPTPYRARLGHCKSRRTMGASYPVQTCGYLARLCLSASSIPQTTWWSKGLKSAKIMPRRQNQVQIPLKG